MIVVVLLLILAKVYSLHNVPMRGTKLFSSKTTKGTIEISQREKSEMSSEAIQLFQEAAEKIVKINAYESEIEKMNEKELRELVRKEKNNIEKVFAIVREASYRVLGLRAFDVQMIGGLIMANGAMVEMQTGEGKTLAAVAPAIFAGLNGKSLVVTVNDYLAQRDADGVGQVARYLGLKVGLASPNATIEEKRVAYNADIVYASNQQVGFDYLRDQLAYSSEDLVFFPHGDYIFDLAIVDEADSILIDEARTPLVISEKKNKAEKQNFIVANELSQDVLNAQEHYIIDESGGVIDLTEKGMKECCQLLQVDDLFAAPDFWGIFILNALKAKELLKKDRDYIVNENSIDLIDVFTGRKLEGRRYADGLQQAVEVKEDLEPSARTKTAASITFQALFKDVLTKKLAACTGTAITQANEFKSVYNLETIVIPTALPIARKDYPDAVYRTVEAKWRAVCRYAAEYSPRPILIGTTSVDDSEMLAQRLKEYDPTKFSQVQILNAKPENLRIESKIIANAGRLGAITVATNMAGRGTDIVLGGDAKAITSELLENLLLLLPPQDQNLLAMDTMTQLVEEAASIAQKLQITTEDDASQITALVCEQSKIPNTILPLRTLQRKALEEIKQNLLEERKKVLDLGGLYVFGTERHESRRIDRQLRGRSGRQGDPGASRFFISVDDRIFKLFGGDSLKRMMTNFRIGDDLPIETPSVAKALDKVQQKVEERNFNLRQQLLTFDSVLNTQRKIIYALRKRLLQIDQDLLTEWLLASAQAVEASVLRDATSDDDAVQLRTTRFAAFFPSALIPQPQLILDGHAQDICTNIILPKIETARPNTAPISTFSQLAILRLDTLWSNHLDTIANLQDAVQFRTFSQARPIDEFQKEAKFLFDKLETKIISDTIFSLLQLAVSSS